MSTPKLNLPKISGNMTADVVRDLNALADAVDANAAKATELASHKADYTSHIPYGTASGTNAKTISLNPVPTSLVAGMALSFKNTTANTGAVTLNVNSLGAKSLLKSGGTALSSGNLKAGGVYTVRYDGTNFILQGEGASGNATASDLLSGKTASTDAGDITGTMPNIGAITITPSAIEQIIPAGYHNGSGKVLPGLKEASGRITGLNLVNGQTVGVSGLSFKPKYVVINPIVNGYERFGYGFQDPGLNIWVFAQDHDNSAYPNNPYNGGFSIVANFWNSGQSITEVDWYAVG